MITFVSLFLGLVLGTQTVEVAVGQEVARVELYLDGRWVAAVEGPPWTAGCDFGTELVPHELVAVALGRDGEELERVRQWINLPRAPAEVGIVLAGGQDGRGRVALLSWESIVADEPQAVKVTFDGRSLEVADSRRIELPPHDPAQLHLLRAEVDFSDTISSVTEVVFGGTYADRVATELTAVPILLPEGGREPSAPELRGQLLAAGEPLEVVTVEKGAAGVSVVRDDPVRRGLRRMEGHLARLQRAATGAGGLSRLLHLRRDQELQFLWPYPELKHTGDHHYALFPTSPTYRSDEAGLFWALTRLEYRKRRDADQQLADAVAVAALSAASRKQRRAVLLVLGRDPEDAGELAPGLVRPYLRRLLVPLFVWSVDTKPGTGVTAWGEVVEVSSPGGLHAAVEELTGHLDRQRIVWVRGIHLPQEIRLAPAATEAGLRLAR